ncbi:hypothetical protein ANCCEY_07847, partial [Ancylostoma ceylanicum]
STNETTTPADSDETARVLLLQTEWGISGADVAVYPPHHTISTSQIQVGKLCRVMWSPASRIGPQYLRIKRQMDDS